MDIDIESFFLGMAKLTETKAAQDITDGYDTKTGTISPESLKKALDRIRLAARLARSAQSNSQEKLITE